VRSDCFFKRRDARIREPRIMLKYWIQKNDGIFIRFANAAIIFSHVVSGGVEGKHIYNILNRGLIIWGPRALMRSVKSGSGDTSYLSTRRYNTCTDVYYFAFVRMTSRYGEIIILLSYYHRGVFEPVSILLGPWRKITITLIK